MTVSQNHRETVFTHNPTQELQVSTRKKSVLASLVLAPGPEGRSNTVYVAALVLNTLAIDFTANTIET